LTATVDHWPALQRAYAWVHRAAHLLGNPDGLSAAALRTAYQSLLSDLTAQRGALGPLAPAAAHFLKVTASYWPGLFHCYDIPDLPRTNNDLEQFFGSVRYHERRATGRKGASPSLVVRGAVRVSASVATRLRPFDATDLQPSDLARWRRLRAQLTARQSARGAQRRFRRDPAAYLVALEQRLAQPSLPP
jgi:hypothetical protein